MIRRSMQALELRVPPPVVGLVIGMGMWWLAAHTTTFSASLGMRTGTAAALALCGIAVAAAGAVSFRSAGTTVNPLRPETTSSLVRSGAYRFTRNPMYLGMLLILLAWAAWLASAWAFIGPIAFVLYMNRFQIAPEERVLAAKFGAEYDVYRRGVRRWL